MSKLRGFTLVEMLAVIAVSSVLLVISTGVVHRSMRLASTWEGEANLNRALVRLASDFRADVHQAQDVALTPDPKAIQLTFPDGAAITYEVATDEIVRDFQSSGQERRREFYHIPEQYQAQFNIAAGQPQWAELRVTRDPNLVGVEPRVVMHVEAEAGRLIRLRNNRGAAP